MTREIRPGDPEFERIATRLSDFMDRMDEAKKRRLAADEISFRQFCATALRSIAETLGYSLKNVEEFLRDMAWAARSGWDEGRRRAQEKRLRP